MKTAVRPSVFSICRLPVMRIMLYVVLSLFHTASYSQLSPGKLFEGHAELEGLSNCTKCHILGQKVANEKCLDCHKEIQRLIDADRGYHASKEVKKQDCIACHSEHHGRKFQIIHFDAPQFDHQLSGYPLEGAHKKIDNCRKCHQPAFILDRDLKKDKDSYLGLGTECLQCHEDYHKNTLSHKCLDCHDMDDFKIEEFDHDQSDFPLRGFHEKVACVKCHKITGEGERIFQQFKDIPFGNCTDCHRDPHTGNLGKDCQSCHSESGFKWNIVSKKFNHNRTNYPLEGKHKRLSCTECHQPDADVRHLFDDYTSQAPYDCDLCHEDRHEGRFRDRCAKCHTTSSFHDIQGLDQFDHSVTEFPLVGKHLQVECKKCHTTQKMTDPLLHETCTACHSDEHRGELSDPITHEPQSCSDCHTESGFAPSTYTIEQHNQSNFQLEGGHMATPCFMCHAPNGAPWHFKGIGTHCLDCHNDIHGEALDSIYLQPSSCSSCHTVESWYEMVEFDHDKTGYQLVGKHLDVRCISCHKPGPSDTARVVFKGIERACSACHEDHHNGQFEALNNNTCSECHTPEDWGISRFDHNLARFKLDGQHKQLECDACHTPNPDGNPKAIIYRNNKLKCIDCHL